MTPHMETQVPLLFNSSQFMVPIFLQLIVQDNFQEHHYSERKNKT